MKTILVEVDLKGAPEAIRNIDGLENAISSLEGELKQAEFGSKEFKQLSKELTKARRELKNTELALEALDSEQVASEFGSLTGAVGDLTGAFVLLGGEDSPVAEAGEKIGTAIGISIAFKGAIEGISSGRKLLNNALATSNTLQKINNSGTVIATGIYKLFGQTVDTTSNSFKGLRNAIIATGIGALVVGVGLLIANFDKLSKALSTTTAEQDAYNEASQKAIENVAKELSAADELKEVLNNETKTREQKVEAVKKLQEEYPSLLSNVDAEKDGLIAVGKALELNTKLLYVKAQQEALAELRAEKFKEILKLEAEARSGANKGLIAQIQGLGLGVDAQKMANLETLKAIKIAKEQIKEYGNLGVKLDETIISLKEEGAAYEDNSEKEKEAAKKTKATRAQLTAAEKRAAAIRRKKIEDSFKEVESVKSRGAQEIEVIHQIRDIETQSLEDKAHAQTMYYESLEELRQKDRAEQLSSINAGLDMTTKALNAGQALGDAVFAHKMKNLEKGSAEEEAMAKKQFKFNKALQLSMAVIDAGKAITASLAQAPIAIGPIPNPAGIASLAFAGITSAAQIATIAAQQFQSSGTPPPAPSPSGGDTGATSQPPAFNVVGQSGFNQIAGALGSQPPVQAFVVSQDVTTAQQLNNAIIETATF